MKPETINHYHLVGVAGVGMSALAQALIAQGFSVSGSDRDYDSGKDLPVLRKLGKAGVRFVPQDGSGVGADTTAVVVSTAIEDDNLDIAAAKKKDLPIIHRAELLARLVEGKQCVAVAGTSGKSTVTGMIGWILEQSGADPTVVNGAPVLNWVNSTNVGNVRSGNSDLWIIEADESDRSFLKFFPDWAIITNASTDHFSMDETKELFKAFGAQAKKEVIGGIERPEFLWGFKPNVTFKGITFEYKGVEFNLPLLGRHNAENAMFAIVLCEKLGYELECIRSALASFRGLQRRLEIIGTTEDEDIMVVDDYAHNPAKICAAWQAVAPYYERVLVVWRPHGFGPLTKMMDELTDTFAKLMGLSDKLFVLPVYDAGGTADRRVDSNLLIDNLRARKRTAYFVKDYKEAIAFVLQEAREDDVVLIMGARDPDLPALAREISAAILHE
ncbi:UDP-N-acetylmuramate--L-alanine ligase [Verrucomicrobiota bacterium]